MCGIVLVKAQATTQKGITMRLLLTAVFLLSANAGMAFGEGRYQVEALGKSGYDMTWVVLDTKTGKTRYCSSNTEAASPICSPWTEK